MAVGIHGQPSASDLGAIVLGGSLGSEVDFLQSLDGGKTWGSTIVADKTPGITYQLSHAAIDEAGDAGIYFSTFGQQGTGDGLTQVLPAGSQTFGSPVDVGAAAPGRLAFDPCEFGAGSTSSGTDPVTVTTFTTSSGGINTGSKMATSVPFSTGGFSPEITAFPPIPGGSSKTGDLEIIFSVTASNGCTTTYQTHAAFDPNTCQLTYSAVAPTIVSGPVCPPKGSYLAEIDNSGFGSCSAGGNPGICVESALTDFSSSGTPPVSDTGMEGFRCC
jgi:hypothetical protein